MALVGVELETLVSEPDALTTRPTVLPLGRYHRSGCYVTKFHS